MFCYLRAVNRNLTFENKILYTDNDHFWWDDNITAFTIRLSEFSDYAKYSKSHGKWLYTIKINFTYPGIRTIVF